MMMASHTRLAAASAALLAWSVGTGSAPAMDAPAVAATLTVTSTDFAFEAPDTVRAGTLTIRLVNQGLTSHHAWLVRLDGARSVRDFERALVANGRIPDWARDAGGIHEIAPGATGEVTLRVGSGRHLVLCAMRLADGGVAVMRGMYRSIEVLPRADAGEPGPAAASVVLEDAGPRLEGRLAKGRQRLRVSNPTSTSHELRIRRLDGGPRPAGGVIALPPGGWAVATLALEPGEYALACDPPPMRGTARPHRHAERRVRID